MKQTAFLYLELPFKPTFLVCFCYFWKVKSLNLFIFEYLGKIFPWKGNEIGIFSKAPDWIPLSLLKIKIKQNPGCPDKKYNAILEYIHHNIMAYPRSKKICIDQWLWKYYCLFGRVRTKQRVGKQVWFVPNIFGGSEGQCHLREIWIFLLSFKLGSSIPST